MLPPATWGQIEGVMNEDTVGNVMSKNVRSIHEDASVFEAMQTLVGRCKLRNKVDPIS